MKTVQSKFKAWLPANWPAPNGIHAGTTLRHSGFSQQPYNYFNLGSHVEDKEKNVRQNRDHLKTQLNLPAEPCWMKQVHGNLVVEAANTNPVLEADGCYTNQVGVVCAVLTADCIPLLLCSSSSKEIACIHIGWQGLCKNIIENALSHFTSDNKNLLAWIGPHISAKNYEISDDIRNACIDANLSIASNSFNRTRPGHWLADLAQLVQNQLQKSGVTNIYHCGRCTYEETSNFFSFRRNNITGRMASLIWLDNY